MQSPTRVHRWWVVVVSLAAIGVCLLWPGGAIAATLTPLPSETTAPLPVQTPAGPVTGSPTPTPTGEAGPTGPATTPAPTPGLTASVSPAPATPTPTQTETPDATATPSPTEAPVAVLPGTPPAASANNQAPLTWLIALIVLLSSMGVLLVVRHRDVAGPQVLDEAHLAPPDTGAFARVTGQLAALESLGEAMIDAGYSVSTVSQVLADTAAAQGAPSTEIVVFPTALFVSTRGQGEIRTGAVSSGDLRLSLGQIDALSDVVAGATSGRLSPGGTKLAVDRVRALQSPYPVWLRVCAYTGMTAALSILLGASWVGVLLACVLGIAVGGTQLAAEHVERKFQALVTVATAFGVTLVVLIVSAIGLDAGVLPSLVAPLVTFLPGALLTTGIIELATGQMMAGAGRLAAGAMQLLLLSGGVVAAAALVGIPTLDLTSARNPLGPLGPWVAVALFGVSTIVFLGGRWQSIGWILLVLYVAYGAQVIGDVFFGSVLSAFVGAAAMTPVAILASRHPSGPAAFVSFLPAFYLLVPGALGLVGVASLLGGDATGLGTLLTTASTMMAISLGVLTGSALSTRLRREHGLLIV